MDDLVVEGFSNKDWASTSSFREKNLSNYERRYNKGTGEPIPDETDEEYYKSTEHEVNDMPEKERTSNAPTRMGNLVNLRNIIKSKINVKEFRGSGILGNLGILGKVKSKISGKTKGTMMPTLESKFFSGKFLDGSLKNAIVMLIEGRAHGGVKIKESKEKDKQKSSDNMSVIDHKDSFDRTLSGGSDLVVQM